MSKVLDKEDAGFPLSPSTTCMGKLQLRNHHHRALNPQLLDPSLYSLILTQESLHPSSLIITSSIPLKIMTSLPYTLDDDPQPTFYGRPSHASTRPHHEPPILDFRAYEEDGHMYDSLHRHPKSALGPEKWYEHTDLDIEFDLLDMYLTWIRDRLGEAIENGNMERKSFYGGLWGVVEGNRSDAKRALNENLDRLAEDIEEDEPELEPGVEIGTSRSWDRERKEWKVYVNRFIRVPDREKKTVTTYGNVAGTGPPVLIEYLDDRPDYAAFMRTHEMYNESHERLCRELGVPGVWDDVCVEVENRSEAGTQKDESIEAFIQELLESSEYMEARGRMIAEWQHHPAATSQPNDGEGLSIVGEQETNRERLVRELLNSSEFIEARDRSIAERRRSLAMDSQSNTGEQLSTVGEQEASDDGDKDIGKWGPDFCFT